MADELDVVQHPVLGTLKFPKTMPFAQRNTIIDQHVAQAKQASASAQRPSMSAAPDPSVWERVKDFVGGINVMPGSGEEGTLGHIASRQDPPLLPVGNAVSSIRHGMGMSDESTGASGVAQGVVQGVANLAQGAASPSNILGAIATGGVGPVARRAVSLGFAALMAKDSGHTLADAYVSNKMGDPSFEVSTKATQGLGEGIMAYTASNHATGAGKGRAAAEANARQISIEEQTREATLAQVERAKAAQEMARRPLTNTFKMTTTLPTDGTTPVVGQRVQPSDYNPQVTPFVGEVSSGNTGGYNVMAPTPKPAKGSIAEVEAEIARRKAATQPVVTQTQHIPSPTEAAINASVKASPTVENLSAPMDAVIAGLRAEAARMEPVERRSAPRSDTSRLVLSQLYDQLRTEKDPAVKTQIQAAIQRETIQGDPNAVPAVSGASGKDLKLGKPVKALENEENIFKHDILSEGKKVGEVMVHDNGESLKIGWVGSDYEAGRPDLQNKLGIAGVRQLSSQLKEMYPKAKRLTGDRISGASVPKGEDTPDNLREGKLVNTKIPEARPTPTAESASTADLEAELAKRQASKKDALPQELAGAKPRYSYGKSQFSVEFENDIDKASYIAAQAKKSSRDADFVKHAMDKTGMSEAEVRAHGARVREFIKSQVAGNDEGVITVPKQDRPKISGLESPVIDPKSKPSNLIEAQAAFDKVQKEYDAAKVEGDARFEQWRKANPGAPFEQMRGVQHSIAQDSATLLSRKVQAEIDLTRAQGAERRVKAAAELNTQMVGKAVERMRKENTLPNAKGIALLEKLTGKTLAGKELREVIHDLNNWRQVQELPKAIEEAKAFAAKEIATKTSEATGRILSKGIEHLEKLAALEKQVEGENVGKPAEELAKAKLTALENYESTLKSGDSRPDGTTLKMHLNPLDPVMKAYTRLVGEPLWDAAKKLLYKASPEFVIRNFYERRYNTPEAYKEAAHEREITIANKKEDALNLARRLSKGLTQAEQQRIGRIVKGEVTPGELNAMRNDPKLADAVEAARIARQELDTWGGQAVVQGLLKEESFIRNFGRYMPRLYRRYEIPYEDTMKRFGQTIPTRLELDRFKRREDIPEEIRLLMGEIKEPAYPVGKGLVQLTNSVETNKLFNYVAANPEWTIENPQGRDLNGYVQMPATPRLGKLSEKFVDEHIAADINQMLASRTELEKVSGVLLSEWKYGKVVSNPSTHARNMVSNYILNYLGGLPPSRVDIYAKAMSELRSKGAIYQEARDRGIMNSTYTQAELNALVDSWNLSSGGLMNRLASMAENMKAGKYAEGLSKIRPSQTEIGRKASAMYQAEEAWFKLAKYMHSREKGMSVKDAAEDAQKWLFDYGDVPRGIEVLRKSPMGAPFLTFTYKAMPRVLESVVKSPWRMGILLGVINAINNHSFDALNISDKKRKEIEANLPPRMQGGVGAPNHVLLPWQDKYGQLQFLDLTYSLPWGDAVDNAGNSSVIPIMSSPVRPLFEIGLNKSVYTKKPIYLETDTKTEAVEKSAAHAYRQLAPAMAPGGYTTSKLYDAFTGKRDYLNREMSIPSAVASSFLGIKVNPIDPTAEAHFRQIDKRSQLLELDKERMRITRNKGMNPEEKRQKINDLMEKRKDILKPSGN